MILLEIRKKGIVGDKSVILTYITVLEEDYKSTTLAFLGPLDNLESYFDWYIDNNGQ